MAVKLYEKIDLKIETREKTSVFPLIVKIELSKSDREEIKLFQKEEETKYKELSDASKSGQELNRQLTRLGEDLEDLNYDIKECEESNEAKELRAERRTLRDSIREVEDRREKISKEFDTAMYQESYEKIASDVAKKTFDMNVEADDKSEALESAMLEHGISYVLVVSELSRLITEAKTKKKKRS